MFLPTQLAVLRQLSHNRDHSATLDLSGQIQAEHGPELTADQKTQIGLMRKEAANPQRYCCAGPVACSVLLAFEPDGHFLAVFRGEYKRAFAGKCTVSACGHGMGPEAACQAFRDAFSLELGAARLVKIGPALGCPLAFFSREFWPVNSDEEAALREIYNGRGLSRGEPPGLMLDYSQRKRSLTAFALLPAELPNLGQLADEITRQTGIPAIHAIDDAGSLTPYLVRLTAEEAATTRTTAAAGLVRFLAAAVRPDATLKDADLAQLGRDTPVFLELAEFISLFVRSPLCYALDLCCPVFSSPDLLDSIRSFAS